MSGSAGHAMELQRQDKGLRAGVGRLCGGLLHSCQALRVGRFGVGREPPNMLHGSGKYPLPAK